MKTLTLRLLILLVVLPLTILTGQEKRPPMYFNQEPTDTIVLDELWQPFMVISGHVGKQVWNDTTFYLWIPDTTYYVICRTDTFEVIK